MVSQVYHYILIHVSFSAEQVSFYDFCYNVNTEENNNLDLVYGLSKSVKRRFIHKLVNKFGSNCKEIKVTLKKGAEGRNKK